MPDVKIKFKFELEHLYINLHVSKVCIDQNTIKYNKYSLNMLLFHILINLISRITMTTFAWSYCYNDLIEIFFFSFFFFLLFSYFKLTECIIDSFVFWWWNPSQYYSPNEVNKLIGDWTFKVRCTHYGFWGKATLQENKDNCSSSWAGQATFLEENNIVG